jgi:hypothetical protein
LFAPHPEIASTVAKPVTRIGEFDGLRCFLSWWKFFRQLGERKPAFWAHLPMLHGVVPNNILPNAVAAFVAPTWSTSLEWQYIPRISFSELLFRFVETERG